jgi:RNA polymerase-binding transcription factor DksA
MKTTNISERVSQLQKRKEKIASTLQHLAGEQAEVEQNTDWLDRAAYESRIQMFDHLNEWYLHELREIEDALERISQDKYGLCLACHGPIETSRLDSFPQAAFCSGCQSAREAVETA